MPNRIKHVRSFWAPATLVFMLALTAFGPVRAADAPLPHVRVTTSMGTFTMELYPERSPLTVANFLRYVREGQYTNTIFHRVVQNFVVQGGGVSAGTYAPKHTHDPIPNESGNGLQNKRGTVGLARATPPHSGDCQFYINLADNPDLDPVPTRWGYAVFGRVIEGMGVVERIGVVPTGEVGPFKQDAPLTPIVIQKVEIVDAGGASTAAPPPNPTARSMDSAPSEVATPK